VLKVNSRALGFFENLGFASNGETSEKIQLAERAAAMSLSLRNRGFA